ncbi:MFS transporter [Herbaspirillum sp. meg3]|jgi:MFS family permease|uniref:MFS transporter n=1 Tax=Herbaspirillum sp. meg3 TaxID=2025949 RepID=UPI000B97D820|nr:MFS transporter [Herbaspirillum sp. meg3]ASU40148.1 MFS transporter [Herbaspirillum sp. meg3]
MPSHQTIALPGKMRSLFILLLCEIGAMAVWFSSVSVVATIKRTQTIPAWDQALLTSSVQFGFVAGTVISALLSLADRYDPRRLFMASALVAAVATGLLALMPPVGPAVFLLRFITGMCMAGVYPVGMRLAVTWAQRDMGLLIGLLVGGLTFGSASPHLLAALGGIDWRAIYAMAAACAALSGICILFCGLGPSMARSSRIDFNYMAQAWRNPAIRLANLGYLGHMWELYAMWAWLAAFLAASFAAAGMARADHFASLWTFAAIAIGAVGAGGGGWLADRFGRTTLTIAAMATSACCAVLIAFLFGLTPWLVVPVALAWGISVIADSAQFSASVAELGDASMTGTLLTVQTCAGFLLTLASIHLVPEVVAWAGWRAGFCMLAIGPALGCVAMYRLRLRPEAMRLASGKR